MWSKKTRCGAAVCETHTFAFAKYRLAHRPRQSSVLIYEMSFVGITGRSLLLGHDIEDMNGKGTFFDRAVMRAADSVDLAHEKRGNSGARLQ
jgi:hypothetical protein